MKLRDAARRLVHRVARHLYWSSGAFRGDPLLDAGITAAWIEGGVRATGAHPEVVAQADADRATRRMS